MKRREKYNSRERRVRAWTREHRRGELERLKLEWIQKLTIQSCSSEQPSSTVDMVEGAAVDSAEGAGCHCRVPRCKRRTCSNGCTFSHFQILMNSAAVTRLFQSAGPAIAPMDPAEDAGYRCREPCVQQRILQRVQGASAECCRAECRARSEKSALSYLQTVDLEPQGSALFASHVRRSSSLSRCHGWPSNSAILNSLTNIFLHSACMSSVRMSLCG